MWKDHIADAVRIALYDPIHRDPSLYRFQGGTTDRHDYRTILRNDRPSDDRALGVIDVQEEEDPRLMTFFGQVSTQLRQSTHSSFFMLLFATIFCTSRLMGHILVQDPQEMHLPWTAYVYGVQSMVHSGHDFGIRILPPEGLFNFSVIIKVTDVSGNTVEDHEGTVITQVIPLKRRTMTMILPGISGSLSRRSWCLESS